MIVPQQRIGQSTAEIVNRAPQTWNYLQHHRNLLSNRASSIYTDKPEFSVFGVGEYSFAPWKVAIAGMYKSLRFSKVGPRRDKPVVFDDTTNFLPCPSQEAAELVHSMLASSLAQTYFAAFVFWDTKRPVTIELLNRLNLDALAEDLGIADEFAACFGQQSSPPSTQDQLLMSFD